MAHITLLYANADHKFAYQLAIQIEQRGLHVWPVPLSPLPPAELDAQHTRSLVEATHLLCVIPLDAADVARLLPHCQQARAQDKHVIAIRCHAAEMPDAFKDCRVIDFEGQFLLAFEELNDVLRKTHASIRPLTVEHPSQLAKPSLLPIRLPSERCWREDRLRINYTLPTVLTAEELEIRIPAFFALCKLELEQCTGKRIRGRRRHPEFHLFDPRRAQHTLTIRRKRGRVQIYYRMTRLQVYHWFPAHYRTLDREAALLYRYLVTGTLDKALLEPVTRQARRARFISWSTIVLFWVFLALILALIVLL